jgi:hypothetical protein
MKMRGIMIAAALTIAAAGVPSRAQNFGMAKTKVTLQRKLPALVPLQGDSIRVHVTAHGEFSNLADDLRSQLTTEILKNNPKLHEDEGNAANTITCEITNVGKIERTVMQQPNLARGKNGPATIPYLRVTASLSVAFQAKTRDGHTVASDNVTTNYDQKFDSSGNNASNGIKGTMSSSWHKITGKSSANQDDQPPSDAELRQKLISIAVQKMASQIVTTNESIDVFLAKKGGAIDEGDKEAEAGLWQRALETFETASPFPKKEDDAYRLYNIGVANEALGYAAEDSKSAMKFLDEAAINYGKAIDDKPSEKYFLDPQKRIETAIAHYRRLEEARNAPPPPPPPPPASTPAPTPDVASAPVVKKTPSNHSSSPKSSPPKSFAMQPTVTTQEATAHGTASSSHALTDSKVIAMVKAGIDDDTLEQTVRNAKVVNFDLSASGRQQLTAGGVSPAVISAMKARASQQVANGK